MLKNSEDGAGALYQCICSLAFSSVHQFWLWILSSFAWVFAFALLAVTVSICVHSDVWEWHRKKSIHWDFQSEDVSWNNVDIPHFLKCKAFQHSSWFSFHICTKSTIFWVPLKFIFLGSCLAWAVFHTSWHKKLAKIFFFSLSHN